MNASERPASIRPSIRRAPAAPRGRRAAIAGAILAAAVLMPAAAGCFRASEGKTPGSPSGAAAPAVEKVDATVLVRLGRFERGAVSSALKVHADLEAIARADVFPEISGVVAEVLAREGDAVAAGQPVVRLVDSDLALTVSIKEVLREQAASKVEQADLAALEFEKARDMRKILLEKSEAEFGRIRALYESGLGKDGIISVEEFDERRYAVEQARIEHESAVLTARKSRVEHTLAEQNRRQAEIEVETARFQLSRTVLRSPIGGRISRLDLRPGELMGSAKLAFSVLDPDRLEARLFVPQRELARLAVGQSVNISCEVFPDKVFDGVLEVINPAVDAANGMIRVIVAIRDPEARGFLKPGMFVNGEIVIETRSQALLATKKAILYENQQPVLFLVEEDRARRYIVEPGFTSRDAVEVLSLLGDDGVVVRDVPEDARLIIQGHNNLKNGALVEIDQGG